MKNSRNLSFAIILGLISLTARAAESQSPQTWSFAVSGDSRNCGDVVMPAIAADALKHNVAFYWHLGDLRKISGPDQDFVQEKAVAGKPTDLATYEKEAGDDLSRGETCRSFWVSAIMRPRRRNPAMRSCSIFTNTWTVRR